MRRVQEPSGTPKMVLLGQDSSTVTVFVLTKAGKCANCMVHVRNVLNASACPTSSFPISSLGSGLVAGSYAHTLGGTIHHINLATCDGHAFSF